GVRLDLRPLGDGEAEPGEDRDDLVAHAHERMHDAARRPPAGQRQIWTRALALSPTLVRRGCLEPRVEQRLQLALGLVGAGPHLGALGGAERAERFEELRDFAGAPEVTNADRLELGRRGGGTDGGTRLARHGFDARVAHAALSVPGPSRSR